MEIQTLAQMLDHAESIVHDQMNATGKVSPIVIAQKGDGTTIDVHYKPPPTAIQRRIHALALGNHFREWGVVSYVVAHEVWMNSAPTLEAALALGRPSKSPDRGEGVMIQAHNIVTSQTRIFRIDRPDGKPKLTDISEDHDRAHPGGTWDNLLMDPNAVH